MVADSGNAAGSGLDFIDGMVFLERYYLVYDVGNSLVGFATTTNTYSNVN